MPAGYFVTGTGTGVGKTVVAAVIARTLLSQGVGVAVFKPALTGLDDHGPDDPPPDHELLRLASGSGQDDDEIAPYRFGPSVSPHLAAELAGAPIDPSTLINTARAATDRSEALVCEGVGGFLVPLTPTYLVRDLARDLALPVVIAASPGLGTINHTLLTIETVRGAGLQLDAVVLTPWPEAPSKMERSNRASIEALGAVRTLTLAEIDLRRPETWPALALAPAPR